MSKTYYFQINDQDVRKMPHKNLLEIIAGANGELPNLTIIATL